MQISKSEQIYNEDDELLGVISQESSGWAARTIFGYVIARTTSKMDAETVLKEQGTSCLKSIWQYYDKDQQDWFTCRLKEIYENRVVIVRTNELGFEDGAHYKRVILKHPTEANLQLS